MKEFFLQVETMATTVCLTWAVICLLIASRKFNVADYAKGLRHICEALVAVAVLALFVHWLGIAQQALAGLK